MPPRALSATLRPFRAEDYPALHALARGAGTIVTRNHTGNRGMLGINERLGFVADPAWLTFRLDLDPGATA